MDLKNQMAIVGLNENTAAAASTSRRQKLPVSKSTNSFISKVPTSKLIETLESMHENVDISVDANVDILSDVFRDVTMLRHLEKNISDPDLRDDALKNIEKNIKDVVIQLKELKSRFDGHIHDIWNQQITVNNNN